MLLISVSQSQIVALDANLEKEYPVSHKGDNGGYGHLRSVGPSLLVYTLDPEDAARNPRMGALRQYFSNNTSAFIP